jgi:hypothetical protein
MTTTESTDAPEPVLLDTKQLLARLNARLALLREWLSHDHGDTPWWWARERTVPSVQRERIWLRDWANALHIERACARGRLRSPQFANLDEQQAWLEKRGTTRRLAEDTSLRQLRDARLPL